jgi:hypothetical protein
MASTKETIHSTVDLLQTVCTTEMMLAMGSPARMVPGSLRHLLSQSPVFCLTVIGQSDIALGVASTPQQHNTSTTTTTTTHGLIFTSPVAQRDE